jgi:hypothetical protein
LISRRVVAAIMPEAPASGKPRQAQVFPLSGMNNFQE